MKKKYKNLLLTTLIAAALLPAAVWLYWQWYLPRLLSETVIPQVGARFGQNQIRLNVRRLGITGADLEEVVLTDHDGQTLSIDSIRLDYAPLPTFRKLRALTIHNLTVSNPSGSIQYLDGKLKISGLNLDKLLPGPASAAPSPAGSEKAAEPFVTLEKVTLHNLQIFVRIGRFAMGFPVEAVLSSTDPDWQTIRFEIKLTPRAQSILLRGTFNRLTHVAELQSSSTLRPGALGDLLPGNPGGLLKLALKGDFDGKRGNIVIDGEYIQDKSFTLPIDLNGPLPFRVGAQFSLAPEPAAQIQFECTPGKLNFNGGLVRLSRPLPIRGTAAGKMTGGRWEFTSFAVQTAPLQGELYGFALTSPELTVTQANRQFLLKSDNIELKNSQKQLTITQIGLSVPLLPTPDAPGKLSVETIEYKNKKLGSVESSFFFAQNSFRLAGHAKTPYLPNARLDFRGTITPRIKTAPDLLFEVNIPAYSTAQPLRLSEWVPSLGEMTVSGTVALGAALRSQNGKMETGAQLFLRDGKLKDPKNSLELSGAEADIRFTDLVNVQTPSGQEIRVGHIKSGKLEFKEIRLEFNIESRDMTVIEGLRVGWCGGELFLRPLRLKTNQKRWSSVLYCENLQLSEMIRQLNLGEATGHGALFGKIPFSLSKTNISFEPGYLYSRPGDQNELKLLNPDQLVGGVGQAVLQQSNTEFASEALKDFLYDYAKINLKTEGETLAVSLQLNGRPHGPLPFRVDDDGQLVRDSNGRATFEGIKLNLNTRLPLNHVLKLNEKLNAFN